MAASGAAASLPGCAGTGDLLVGWASATSSGRSRCTGPCGSLSASRIASVSVSTMRARLSGSVALVIGLNSAWWSIHIWMRRPSWSGLRLQVIAIIGERSRKAEPTPVARLVAPGPERCDAEPGRAGHAAGHVGGEAGRAFVGGEHELDPALAHRLHQRQHVATGNPEAAGDAVRPQRCDDQIGVVHATANIICGAPAAGSSLCGRFGFMRITCAVAFWQRATVVTRPLGRRA